MGIEKSGLIPAISLALSISVGVLAAPSFRQRIYTAKNVSVVKRSFYISAIAYFAFSLLPVIIGISAYTINPELANSNMAFPFMATAVLPPIIGTLVLVSGISASMSSGDSDAITGVTILLRDVWVVVFGKVPDKNHIVTYSRWAIFLSILLAFSFCAIAEDVLGYISKMISTIMSGICVTAVLGRFWKRATWQGAVAALISGSVISISIMMIPSFSEFWGNPIIPSLAGAFLFHIGTSFLTPKNKITPEKALEIINRERKSMD